jgi:hypothetical protein
MSKPICYHNPIWYYGDSFGLYRGAIQPAKIYNIHDYLYSSRYCVYYNYFQIVNDE